MPTSLSDFFARAARSPIAGAMVGNAGPGMREAANAIRLGDREAAQHRRQTKAKADEKTTAFIREQRKLILANGLEALKTAPASVRPKVEAALGRFAVQNMGMDPAVIPSLFATIPPVETLNAQALQKELEKSAIGSATAGSQIAAAQGGGLGVLRAPAKWLNVPRGTQAVRVDPETGKTEVVHTNTLPSGRKPRQSVDERRMDRMTQALEKAQQEFKEDPSFSNKMELAIVNMRHQGQALNKGVGFVDRQEQALRNKFKDVVKFDAIRERVLKLLDDPETRASPTTAGKLAVGMTSMVSNISGMFALFPGMNPKVVLDQENSAYAHKLNSLAGANQKLKTAMFGLAVLNAFAEGLTSRNMSMAMVERQLENLGADSTNPNTYRERLQEVSESINGSLDVALDSAMNEFKLPSRDAPASIGAQRARIMEKMAEDPEFAAKVQQFANKDGMTVDKWLNR